MSLSLVALPPKLLTLSRFTLGEFTLGPFTLGPFTLDPFTLGPFTQVKGLTAIEFRS